MEFEFFSKRKFLLVDPRKIKRVRWSPSDGGHGEPVCHAVLIDGTIGRFLEYDRIADYIRCLAVDVDEHSFPVVALMLPVSPKELRAIISQGVPDR